MSVTTTANKTQSLGGVQFNDQTEILSDGMIVHEEIIPAGNPSELTTRTSDTVGELTMDNAGHTINTGNRLDLYWEESGVKKRRRDVLAGTVVGTAVPFTLGSGDILPSTSTNIVASVPVELDINVAGDQVVAILLVTEKNGQFSFEDGGAEVLFVALRDSKSFVYHEQEEVVNPIIGDTIDSVFISHDDPAATKIMSVGIAYNNV